MALTNEHIKEKLAEKFGDQVFDFKEEYDLLSFTSDKELNLKVLNFLVEEASLQFTFLTDLCGVHYPDNKGKELAVVYHLHNLRENVRVRYKVFTDVQHPDVYTATGVFAAANWMERD